LLDAEGRLWVTDFGLAQVRGDDRLTLTGDVLGTLRYMSPEQALGRRVVIDGRTDLYSLGVTLYELLSLHPAIDGRDRAEILRKVAEDEPTPLRRLNPAVPADLETIILKMTAKDPGARYATAQELAEDLRNFFEDRPIRARRPGLLDRAARWSRRHRAVMTTAALLLVLGTSVSLWQAMKAREAAAEAGQRAEESRQVVDYLAKDIFGTGAAKKGKKKSRSVTVRELLDAADASLTERFGGQPLVEASVRMAFAESYQSFFESRRAVQNAARAAEIREQNLGPEHPATLGALALQVSIFCRGGDLQKVPAAERIARRVLAARRRALGPDHPDTLSAQTLLANTVTLLDRHDEAEDLAVPAAGLAIRVLGPGHEVTLYARHILGYIFWRRGDLARAEPLLREVLAAYEQTLGDLHYEALLTLHDLAQVVRLQGRAGEARILQLETINRFVQAFGICHIQTSGSIRELFSLLREQRDFVAIRDLCEGWIREILTWPPEPDPHERSRRAVRLLNCALTLAALPEPVPFDAALAVRAAEEAAALEKGWYGWTILSAVLSRARENEKALEAVQTASQQGDWKEGNDLHWFIRALVHARLGQAEKALSCYQRACGADLRRDTWDELVQCIRRDVEARLRVSGPPVDTPARP
jgi:tetratricopeptide (TPR) repeat protein